MPVAMLQEWAPSDDRTTTNYDLFGEKLGAASNPPAGLIVHSAGFSSDGVFRIYEVWETREDQERFARERLAPLIDEMMAAGTGAPPVRQELYDVHAVVQGA